MDRDSFVSASESKYNGARASLTEWFSTPQGRYVLDWEHAQFDRAVEDVFGYRAIQIGLPEIAFLRSNRMPFRFSAALEEGASVATDPLQLPIASQSLDLVALPHALETHANPHQMLREADRVLRPEGQVVISGFNPISLWRLRQVFQRGDPAPPWDARFVGLFQLRDWLGLLGFELNGGRFGCYAPAFRNAKWLERFRFMEAAGARWWPIAGGLYVVRAIKRVHGMRIVTPPWRRARARGRAFATVPQRNGHAAHRARYEEPESDG